jgi:diguanylate cyclase (GGDEF)-like protein
MDQVAITETIIEPAASALVVFFVITYLRRQSRDTFFRVWQVGWGLQLLYYAITAWRYLVHDTLWKSFAGHLALSAVVVCVFLSARTFKQSLQFTWKEVAASTGLVAWSVFSVVALDSGSLRWGSPRVSEVEIGAALLLAWSSYLYWRLARSRRSQGLLLLSIAVGLWSVFVLFRPVHSPLPDEVANYSHFMGPLLQMAMGIALVMLLFEEERRTAQENLLAFSSLETSLEQLLTPAQVAASMQRLLSRLLALAGTDRAAIFIQNEWRSILPHAQSGFSQQFLVELEEKGLGAVVLGNMRRQSESGDSLRWRADMTHLQKYQSQITEIAQRHSSGAVIAVTALALRSQERTFGFVLFGHQKSNRLAFSKMSLLKSLAKQLGTTLDHYVQLHEARRHSKEYKLLTQIGQAVSSRLNTEDVFRTIHRELGQIFDTSSFYAAFKEGNEICFEFECHQGEIWEKRSRKLTNGVTEYIIAGGQPMLIRSEMEKHRAELGLTTVGPKAKCFCGVPMFISGKSVGVMAALNYDHEFVYDERDLELLRTAADQVVIAIENARTFQREQRRALDLTFLNNVSRIAINSKDPNEMMGNIVAEMQRSFHFDHVSIGLLDYSNKEVIIKAEAGSGEYQIGIGKRMPFDTGLIGVVARSNEASVVQENANQQGLALLPESQSVLCHPITFGETLLGVLNVERAGEGAFTTEEVLILGTLGDLLATALQNVFSFQKMEHQSITDSLTGLKTRRFFLEALQSEWKRATRSGRPFSLLMIDLDKFKQVNDGKGHLEGDLVLARIGRLLEQKVRQSNVVARYGGDEFVVLLPETGLEQAQILAERLRVWIASDLMLSERNITGSFGVATFPMHGSTIEEVLAVADEGMYLSKHAGGNRVSHARGKEESDDTRNRRQLISSHLEAFLHPDINGHRSPELLKAALHELGEQVPARAKRQVLMEALRLISHALEANEDHAAGHGELVARHSEAIGQHLGWSPEELADLTFAAHIHDIGKIVIPLNILNKAGSLTAEEYLTIKKHPEVGADIASVIPDSERIQAFIRCHQEHFDGSGYPGGLKAEQIPLGARIIGVAEAFAWILVQRPYGGPHTADAAAAVLKSASEKWFDRKVVEMFLQSVQSESRMAATV